MKILITGVAGFIGSHLAMKLLGRGDQVLGIDNLNSQYDISHKERNLSLLTCKPAFQFIRGDFCESEFVSQIFRDHRPPVVLHFGAMGNVRKSILEPLPYVNTNICGTAVLLESASEYAVEHFVFASTSSVYGNTDLVPFTEDQSTDRPLAPYPASKKSCELLAHAFHNMHKLNVTVLRLFNVYGPRGRPDMMPFMVADTLTKGTALQVFEGGTMSRDWTYIDDIVAGVVSAMERPQGYEIYNLGRGQPVSLNKFIEILEELSGKQLKRNEAPAPLSEPKITYADIKKAKSVLGYSPKISIAEGLQKFWQWYRHI